MAKLNLACGRDYKEGWVNTDISTKTKADKYFDVRKDFPLESSTFEVIYCSGVLEQILTNEDFTKCMNECHRVLKHNGEMTVIVPNSKYSITFRDPYDCRHFLEETWNYLDRDHQHYQLYGSVYGFLPWKVQNVETNKSGIMTVKLICQKE